MSKQKIFLLLIGAYAMLAFLTGLFYVSQGKFSEPSFAFVPLGSFIWGDALILGLFLFVGSLFLWRTNNGILTGLFISLYVLIRSSIEALYWLNSQFSTTDRPWEIFWRTFPLSKSVPLMEIYVYLQLFYTVLIIVSLMFSLKFLKQYLRSK